MAEGVEHLYISCPPSETCSHGSSEPDTSDVSQWNPYDDSTQFADPPPPAVALPDTGDRLDDLLSSTPALLNCSLL